MPSGPEWFIILAVVLVVFGGSQLPTLARNLGKAQREFKEALAEGEPEAAANQSTNSSATDMTATEAPGGEASGRRTDP